MQSSQRNLAFYSLVMVFLVAAPFLGSVPLSFAGIFDTTTTDFRIFTELRIPRLILCFSAGASLALLGAVYQLLFHNDLAEPYVLGVSSASTLGIFIFETFCSRYFPAITSSFSGILVALLYTFALLQLTRRILRNPERIILFGMGANFFLSAVLFLLISYAQSAVGSGSMRWLFGQVPWVDFKTALVIFLGCSILIYYLIRKCREIDVLSLGDNVARSLGVNPQSSRRNFLFVSSILLGLIASTIGTVGFVGLVVPHAVRLWLKPTQTKSLFLHTLILGGAFLVFSDAVSRAVLPPVEFPVGVVTTFLGGPFFLYLLWKR